MKTIRIFDSNNDCMSGDNPFPDEWTPMLEYTGVGNDGYHEWTVGEGNDSNGGGYISEQIEQETDQWLLKAGANPGEEVLIKFWW